MKKTMNHRKIKISKKILAGMDEFGEMVGAGIYIYRIQAISLEDNSYFSHTRKMILLK